jgi:hypothetical protein
LATTGFTDATRFCVALLFVQLLNGLTNTLYRRLFAAVEFDGNTGTREGVRDSLQI